jgi:ABC-2 type transport system ATP-binding protein
MIELFNVSKKYGNKLAVDDLTLKVEPGELFAFLGPNGAGKTTTIKMICGLLFPSSGSVRVGGFDVQSEGLKARRLLSYVPDQPFVYERLTGREFLQFIAEMYGLSSEHTRKRIEEMIRAFELREFVDDLALHYSHGMRQRLVFAAALLHEPRVLVADEPTVGLDPRSIRWLKDLFRELTRQGNTVFLSTHTLDVAEELADRIGIMDRGRLISLGTLDALRTQAAVDGSLEKLFLTLTEPPSEKDLHVG